MGLSAFVSRACFRFFSKTFFASQKPCLVFPKELGPADVGVSLEMTIILSSQLVSILVLSMFMYNGLFITKHLTCQYFSSSYGPQLAFPPVHRHHQY